MNVIITGIGPWEKPATDAEAMRMAIYVQIVEAHDGQSRCATCAFRSATPANRSSLVVRMVEHCLQTEGSFRCHTLPEGRDPERECVGFTIIKTKYTPT